MLESAEPVRSGDRRPLDARQAELLEALLVSGRWPAGFPADRLAAARTALLTKRAAAVLRHWRPACRSLGADFLTAFAAYASSHPAGPEWDAVVDGRHFLAWLRARRVLPDVAKLHLAAFDARLRCDAVRALPRTRPYLRVVPVRRPRTAVVVLSVGGRRRVIRLRLGRARMRRDSDER